MLENFNPNEIVAREQIRREAVLWNNQQEVLKTVAKEQYLNDQRMDLANKKILLSECRREMRKAEFDRVMITGEGKLQIQTQNAIIDFSQREITNFYFRKIIYLTNPDGSAGVYRLYIKLESEKTSIFLNEKKVANAEYLMKKIVEVGGEIYTNTRKDRENFLRGFWVQLHKRCTYRIIIPEERGWNIDEHGNLKFVKAGDLIWKEIMEYAK